MRTKSFAIATVLAFGAAVGPAAAEVAGSRVTVAPVKSHASQGDVRAIQGAEAVLSTTQDGAFVSVSTSGLTPGHAHTMWFVAINAPEACETSPCKSPDVMARTAGTVSDVGFADGLIVGADGTGRFAARIPVGALRYAWFGNGYRNAQGAEIHVTIADHGPIVPEYVDSMLSSFRGGCTDESLSAAVPDTARSNGTPGPNSCKVVQFAVFEQDGEQRASLR